MSRTLPGFRGRRTLMSLAAGTLALATVAGCGVSRIAQTATQQPTIPGVNGNAGSLLIRNAYIVPPAGDSYAKGGNAPLELRLVNDSTHDDRLISVSTSGADSVVLVSGSSTSSSSPVVSASPSVSPSPSASPSPSVSASASGSPSTSASPSTPASPSPSPSASASGAIDLRVPVQTLIALTPGGQHLELQGLHRRLRAGDQLSITFTFARAGQTTLQVPVATPTSPVPHPSVTPTVGPGEPQTN